MCIFAEANFCVVDHFGGLYKYLRYVEFAEVTAENLKFAYTTNPKIREITVIIMGVHCYFQYLVSTNTLLYRKKTLSSWQIIANKRMSVNMHNFSQTAS
jgi:hypothetical protein